MCNVIHTFFYNYENQKKEHFPILLSRLLCVMTSKLSRLLTQEVWFFKVFSMSVAKFRISFKCLQPQQKKIKTLHINVLTFCLLCPQISLGYVFLQLRQFIHISTKKFGSLNIIFDVDFFILTMGTIIASTHWKQNYILAGCFM